jgi:hypothetical protein
VLELELERSDSMTSDGSGLANAWRLRDLPQLQASRP